MIARPFPSTRKVMFSRVLQSVTKAGSNFSIDDGNITNWTRCQLGSITKGQVAKESSSGRLKSMVQTGGISFGMVESTL